MKVKNFIAWLNESTTNTLFDTVKYKLLGLGIWGGDISAQSTCSECNNEPQTREFFVIHHTAGHGGAPETMKTLNSKQQAVNWVVDRAGKVWLTREFSKRGNHILDSDNSKVQDFNVTINGKILTNSNTEGVEVCGLTDAEVAGNANQIEATCQLIFALGYTPQFVVYHGQINPGRKAENEGKTIRDRYAVRYYELLKASDPNSLYGQRDPNPHRIDNTYMAPRVDPNKLYKKKN